MPMQWRCFDILAGKWMEEQSENPEVVGSV